MKPDDSVFHDLLEFARYEQETGGLHAARDLLAHMDPDTPTEEHLWVCNLYAAYGNMHSAWLAYAWWSTPMGFQEAADKSTAQYLPVDPSRRNLRSDGAIQRRLQSSVDVLDLSSPIPQADWLDMEGPDQLLDRLQTVWGVGPHQGAEWADLLHPYAFESDTLWLFPGPIKALIRLYPHNELTQANKEEAANAVEDALEAQGVALDVTPPHSCDLPMLLQRFSEMCDGRDYPGRALAKLKDEIAGIESLNTAAPLVFPGWADVSPGVNRSLETAYARTGRMGWTDGR